MCEEAVENKKQSFKIYLKDKSDENHVNLKQANVKSNMTVAQAKKDYWASYCLNEISDHKDFSKVWKKMNEMKKGISLPDCPITIDANKFPSDIEKAEEEKTKEEMGIVAVDPSKSRDAEKVQEKIQTKCKK